jgi:DNA polymerase III alpha subunit
MKKSLIGLLIFGSISSFANILENPKKEKIIEAIFHSEQNYPLRCTGEYFSTQLDYKTTQYELKSIQRLYRDHQLDIIEEDQLVVIKLSKELDDLRGYETFYLSKDLTKVVKSHGIVLSKKVQRSNAGTIPNPDFHSVIKWKKVADVKCE